MNIKKNLLLSVLSTALFAAADPGPPLIPEVQAISGHEYVKLMWNNDSESSIDLLTGYSDFEGYRIYRSTDRGITWGNDESDKIYDYNQTFIGWKPYAQFDLSMTLDSTHCIYSNNYFDEKTMQCEIRGTDVSGYDPMAVWINIGDNSNIKRQFIDTEVLDGVEYTYAVTAYDMGMVSFRREFISQDEDGAINSYCSDDGSYCEGKQCCDTNSCCSISEKNTQSSCENIDGIWLPQKYSDEESCLAENYEWQDVNNELADYSDKKKCEDAGFEWQIIEFLTQESCELVGHTWHVVQFTIDTLWTTWNPGHFIGLDYSTDSDELWGYPSFESSKFKESFADFNLNGKCDYDQHSGDYESFFDLDSSDTGIIGKCDQIGDWTKRCPEDCRSEDGAVKDYFNKKSCNNAGFDWGISNCINVKVIEAGYKASNYTEPADFPDIHFLVPDSGNRGNGERLYNIVNEYDLPKEPTVLRFEITAGLDPDAFGDSTGSFATLDPSLYIYTVISVDDYSPSNTWDKYVDDLSQDSLLYYLELPGVSYNSSDNNFISIPFYNLQNFKLTYIDDPLYESHYTEWFNGIQFRFDNGPNKINDVLSLVEIKQFIYSNISLEDIVTIKMKYNAASDIAKRPMYRYKIDFSASTFLDTAMYGTGRDCDQYEGYPDDSHTLLPFKITNITNGELVDLNHNDKGVHIGQIEYNEMEGDCEGFVCDATIGLICVEGECVQMLGNRDCSWQHNEIMQSEDIVFSDSDKDGKKDKLFDFKIDFDWPGYAELHEPDYFGDVFLTTGWDWKAGSEYADSALVFYQGMLYRSIQSVNNSIPPNFWFDNNGDAVNDNPWKMLYPWNDGDFIIVEPYGWYQDGDAWVADLSRIGKVDDNTDDDLNDVSAVPNPYIVDSNYFNESPGNQLLRFIHLPTKCTISIYTISGEFVTSIYHDDPFSGNEWWNLKNGQNELIAPGLYIYVVQTPSGDKKIGKFAVVR